MKGLFFAAGPAIGGTSLQTSVAFGRGRLLLELPDGPEYAVLEAHAADALADPSAAVAEALKSPIGCAPLLELALGKRSAAISVCDITRPAPNGITLPPLLETLHEAGIERENVLLCVATGLHREATAAELQTILSPEIAARYPILNHDARDRSAHRLAGVTRRGTPAWIDRRFLDAELHLTLGFIEQHLMLGFSGGRKLIAPGLAGEETIKVIHSPRFMRESLATEGSIEGNPLHAELLEIAELARHDFMLDVTLTQDRRISGVFAGEPVQAHAAGVAALRGSSVEHIAAPVDAVMTSAAGHPLDLTFYQAIKGVTAAQHIAKPGGRILIMGRCEEGVGSPEFAAMVRAYAGAREFLEGIRDAPVAVDQWQLEKLALVALRYELLFYLPGVTKEDLGALGDRCFDDAEEAIGALLKGLPDRPRVAVIPDGPYAFARVRTGAGGTRDGA